MLVRCNQPPRDVDPRDSEILAAGPPWSIREAPARARSGGLGRLPVERGAPGPVHRPRGQPSSSQGMNQLSRKTTNPQEEERPSEELTRGDGERPQPLAEVQRRDDAHDRKADKPQGPPVDRVGSLRGGSD